MVAAVVIVGVVCIDVVGGDFGIIVSLSSVIFVVVFDVKFVKCENVMLVPL